MLDVHVTSSSKQIASPSAVKINNLVKKTQPRLWKRQGNNCMAEEDTNYCSISASLENIPLRLEITTPGQIEEERMPGDSSTATRYTIHRPLVDTAKLLFHK